MLSLLGSPLQIAQASGRNYIPGSPGEYKPSATPRFQPQPMPSNIGEDNGSLINRPWQQYR